MNDIELGIKLDDSGAMRSLTDIEREIYELGVATKKTNSTIKKETGGINKSFKATVKEVDKLNKAIGNIGGKVVKTALAGTALSIGAIAMEMRKLTQMSDDVTTLGDAIDMNYESVQAWDRALKDVGSSMSETQRAFGNLSKAIGKGSDGNKKISKVFDGLSISLKKSNGDLKSTDKIMKELLTTTGKMSASKRMKIFADLGLQGNNAINLSALSQTNQSGYNKGKETAIPASQMVVFNDMRTSIGDLQAITRKHVAPWLSTVATGMTNVSDNLYSWMNSIQPKSQKEATEAIVNGLVRGAMFMQGVFNNLGDTFTSLFKKFTTVMVTMGMKLAGLLTGIITALAPMAILGMTLDSIAAIAGATIHGITMATPFVPEALKQQAQQGLNDLAKGQYKKAIDNLDKSINTLTNAIDSGDFSGEKLIKMEDELLKAQKAKRHKQARFDEINNGKTYNMGVAEARYASYEAKGDTEGMKRIAAIIVTEKKKANASLLEISDALKGDVLNIGLTLAGLGLGKYAAKSLKSANAVTRAQRAGGLVSPYTAQKGKSLMRSGLGVKATQVAAGGLKMAPLLMELTDFVGMITNGVDIPKIKKTEEELKAYFTTLFTKTTAVSGGKASKRTTDATVDPYEQELGLELEEKLNTIEESWVDKFNQFTSTLFNTSSPLIDMVNAFADASIAADQRRLDSWKETEQYKLDSTVLSDRRREDEQRKLDAKMAERQKAINKRQARQQIANTWIQAFSGAAGAFAQAAGTIPPPAGPIIGGVNAGLVLTTAGVNTARMKDQAGSFSEGGVYGGFNGVSYGRDDMIATVKRGELNLNGPEQRELYDLSRGKGGRNTTINIENFSGGDNELVKLEELLVSLESNGRIKGVVA